MPLAQIAVQASLDDSEERATRALGTFPFRLAASGPAGGARHRLLVPCALRSSGQALVEAHEDVASELELDPGGTLGGEKLRAAVEMAAESGALLVDLAPVRERIDLEASRVG